MAVISKTITQYDKLHKANVNVRVEDVLKRLDKEINLCHNYGMTTYLDGLVHARIIIEYMRDGKNGLV